MKTIKLAIIILIIGAILSIGWMFLTIRVSDYSNQEITSENVSNTSTNPSISYDDHNIMDNETKALKTENFKGHFWNHMPITYKYDLSDKCEYTKVKKMEYAFDEIEKWTNNIVYFEEEEGDISEVDLVIRCFDHKVKNSDEEYNYETLGEAVYEYFIDNSEINNAEIYFYSYIDSCGYYPFTELHEILHIFSFTHTDKNNKCSIMYPYEECDWKYENQDICYNNDFHNREIGIDEDIANKLMEVYG